MAAKTSTEILQEAFPGRVAISPKEAAKAIYGEGKDTKKRVESIRGQLDNGTLIPGLRKRGARWSIPIAALGEAMDERRRREQASTPIVHASSPGRSRSNIGPRMYFQAVERSRVVWTLLLQELDALNASADAAILDALLPPAPHRSGPRQL